MIKFLNYRNNNGFTLVELLAILFILGIIMTMTIPNIAGIINKNRVITYAEDAKKLRNVAEYKFRSDNTINKPKVDNDCIVANLGYFDISSFKNPPYGGKYDLDHTFVVMKKIGKRYKYAAQIIEEVPDSKGYRGIGLIDLDLIENSNDDYWNNINNNLIEEDFLPASVASIDTINANAWNSTLNCKVIGKYYAYQ